MTDLNEAISDLYKAMEKATITVGAILAALPQVDQDEFLDAFISDCREVEADVKAKSQANDN